MRSSLRLCGIVLLGAAFAGCDTTPGALDHSSFSTDGSRSFFASSSRSLYALDHDDSAFEDTVGHEPMLYRLGELNSGDHISISIQLGSNAERGPVVGLFNSGEEALAVDARFAGSPTLRESTFEYQIMASDEYFLGLAMAAGQTSSCHLAGNVRYSTAAQRDARPTQTLVLNFDGGTVRIGANRYSILPFDAARIHSAFADYTDLIKSQVVNHVRSAFAGHRIVIKTSDDPEASAAPHATMYFGDTNHAFMGISQHLDNGNLYCCDSGLVFTDQMSRRFAFRPSVAQMSTVIANVACHEAGHLLGLNHTNNPADFMDISAGQTNFLTLRSFAISSLHDDVFPLGLQNGPALLQMNLAE